MPPPQIICAGLSCLDLLLHNTRPPETLEQITPFTHTTHTPGGSAPQTALSLSALNIPTSILTLLGTDTHGKTLVSLLNQSGVDTTSIVYQSSTTTSLSILPVFTDGRRGCFVTLGANNIATADTLLEMLETVDVTELQVFHFGYPHLMPLLQAANLARLYTGVRNLVPQVRLSLDLNGADVSDSKREIITSALGMIDFLHANLEEACIITGLYRAADASRLTEHEVGKVVRWFTRGGLVVAVTAGKNGAFIGKGELVIYRQAFTVKEGFVVNASGAGDAFVAGVLAIMVAEGMDDMALLADAGMASSLKRIEPGFGDSLGIVELVELARRRTRISPSGELKVAREGDDSGKSEKV